MCITGFFLLFYSCSNSCNLSTCLISMINHPCPPLVINTERDPISFAVIHGFSSQQTVTLTCGDLQGSVWTYKDLYGATGILMDLKRSLSSYRDLCESKEIFVELQGSLCNHIVLCGSTGISGATEIFFGPTGIDVDLQGL